MSLLHLPKREWLALQDLMTDAPSALECRRAQALSWLAKGIPAAEVADRLQVSRRTVYYWLDRFQERADLDLADRLADALRSGRPAIALGIIDPWIDEVIDQDPRSFGYASTVWTARLLQQYLQDGPGIPVSQKSISRAIAQLGSRWKRPRHCLGSRPATGRQGKGG